MCTSESRLSTLQTRYLRCIHGCSRLELPTSPGSHLANGRTKPLAACHARRPETSWHDQKSSGSSSSALAPGVLKYLIPRPTRPQTDRLSKWGRCTCFQWSRNQTWDTASQRSLGIFRRPKPSGQAPNILKRRVTSIFRS